MKYIFYCSLVISAFCNIIGCNLSQNAQTVAKSTPPDISQTNQNVSSNEVKQSSLSTKKNLEHLRKWVGKYPINTDQKNHRNFFEVMEVKTILTEILGQKGFQNLLKHFYGDDLIYEKAGFLVMLGTTDRNAAQDVDYGLVAIKPDTGETHILFSDSKRLTSFSNKSGEETLPIEIKEDILIYTDADQSSIVSNFRPQDENFECYAVLYDDWDIIASNRPYIFISTDTGGIMKVENTIQNVKYVSSSEKKSETENPTVEWIYANEKVRAVFDMKIRRLLNEGSDIEYEGTLKVATRTKNQSLPIKAFCGG